MRFCDLCGFHRDRSGLCELCVDNLMEAGSDRDEAEEAYLAMADDLKDVEDESLVGAES